MARHWPRLARGPGLNGQDSATAQERQEELEGVLVGEVTFFGMVNHIKGNRGHLKGLVSGHLFHPPSQISSSSMTTEEVEDVEGRSSSRKATSGILQTGTVNPSTETLLVIFGLQLSNTFYWILPLIKQGGGGVLRASPWRSLRRFWGAFKTSLFQVHLTPLCPDLLVHSLAPVFTSLNQVDLIGKRHFVQDYAKVSFEATSQVLWEVLRHKRVFPFLVFYALCQPGW